jgi:hypothetical protein
MKLFDQTDYVARICENILFLLSSLNDLHVVCDDEVFALTCDHDINMHRIGKLIMSLTATLYTCDYDIFDENNAEKWQETMLAFQEEKDRIKSEIEVVIETAFQKLRLSEIARALVMKMNRRQENAVNSIDILIKGKNFDIIDRYFKELRVAKKYCKRYTLCQSVCWRHYNYPAGIVALNEIHRRVKDPILSFENEDLMLMCKHGNKLKQNYHNITNEIESYLSNKYTSWLLKAREVCHDALHIPVLSEIKLESTSAHRIEINFPQELRTIISEAKRFLLLGYDIPEILTNLTIQLPIFER